MSQLEYSYSLKDAKLIYAIAVEDAIIIFFLMFWMNMNYQKDKHTLRFHFL